jgi:hypothetical protein
VTIFRGKKLEEDVNSITLEARVAMHQRLGLNLVWRSSCIIIGIRVGFEKGGRIVKLMSSDSDMPILLFRFIRTVSSKSDLTYASNSICTIVY